MDPKIYFAAKSLQYCKLNSEEFDLIKFQNSHGSVYLNFCMSSRKTQVLLKF